jgi:hypothetical protein
MPSYILIGNQSSRTFRLSIPGEPSFTSRLIANGAMYSVPFPTELGRGFNCELRSSSPKVYYFRVSKSGELRKADKGLLITNIKNGLSGMLYGVIPIGVDERQNNGLVILPFSS